MIRYATNPPHHYAAHEHITSPHLYQHRRSTSTVFRPASASSPLTYLRSVATYATRRARTYRWHTLTNLLRLLWLVIVIWGERHVWSSALSACEWDTWESWPAGATPYRIALVADPQLVDVHTYPRRGLSLAATIYYTDKYLTRAWSGLHRELAPIETYFLGDLFDGGREWGVSGTAPKSVQEANIAQDPSALKDWADHGNEYWLGEFDRWEKIFGTPPGVRSRRGIPGNHDLGFGGGVKESVRGRFRAFFGDGEGRWSVGNHTFVSVDAVSLSNEKDPAIYGPGREFLESLDREVRVPGKWGHDVVAESAAEPEFALPSVGWESQPTVLLTHVPLYRQKGTPCGPHRERGTSIPIWQGYQYQNVLSPTLSTDLLKKTHAKYVFSGDDHDACEVTHMYGPQGRVKEWTVKSVSWTMGVRRPAFELVSLWNPAAPIVAAPTLSGDLPAHVAETPEQLTARLGPIEERNPELAVKEPGQVHGGAETLQAKLCYLPDQIGVFLTYAVWGLVSVILVAGDVWWSRAARKENREGARGGGGSGKGLLPTVEPWKGLGDKEMDDGGEAKYWKPKPKKVVGKWWWAAELAEEVGRVAAVALGVYGVLLWRW